MSSFLSLTNVQKEKNETPILKNVNLEIKENEIVSIVGNSGSGKSTLLNIIAGLDKQTQGKITLRGREVEGPGQDRSVIFEKHNFLPWLTSYENIEAVLKKVMPELEPQELKERVCHFVRIGGLEEVKDIMPSKMPMEMKKRLAITRSLAIHPDVLLMDNPFSSLDTKTRYKLQAYLIDIQKSTKCTVIITTGNVEEALFLSNRVIMMHQGEKSIHDVLDVVLPYPRDRITLQADAVYTKSREKIFQFLYGNQ